MILFYSERRSTRNPFISTDSDKIKLHQDAGIKGRTTEFVSKKMPRTLLSTVTAESPTAFLARQEMRNWMMLQFEPSTLRQPNSIYDVKNAKITASGYNLSATLFRLNKEKAESDIFQSLTNRLKSLVEDIHEIGLDKDEKRDLITLQAKFKDGLTLPAQSLSDGTLRFLGLAVIEEDNRGSGLICLEEPENGINPKKVNEMLELLIDMATDIEFAVNEDNPLRQVIINSHSPIVVGSVPEDSLYLAKDVEILIRKFGRKIKCTGFSALHNTWKTNSNLTETTSLGEICAYLESSHSTDIENESKEPDIEYLSKNIKKRKRTVSENIKQLKMDL